MLADADRIETLERERARVMAEELHAQQEYTEIMQRPDHDDAVARAALYRLWHAQGRQRELIAELESLHH